MDPAEGASVGAQEDARAPLLVSAKTPLTALRPSPSLPGCHLPELVTGQIASDAGSGSAHDVITLLVVSSSEADRPGAQAALWLVWKSAKGDRNKLAVPLSVFGLHLFLGNWWNGARPACGCAGDEPVPICVPACNIHV